MAVAQKGQVVEDPAHGPLVGRQVGPDAKRLDALDDLARAPAIAVAGVDDAARHVRRAGHDVDLEAQLHPAAAHLVDARRRRVALGMEVVGQEEDAHRSRPADRASQGRSSFTREPSRRRRWPQRPDRTRSLRSVLAMQKPNSRRAPAASKRSAVRSLPGAELRTIVRRFERELARSREADLEDAARVPDPRGGPRELLHDTVRVQVQARARRHAAGARDLVLHQQHAALVPGEAALVARPPRADAGSRRARPRGESRRPAARSARRAAARGARRETPTRTRTGSGRRSRRCCARASSGTTRAADRPRSRGRRNR